MNQSQFGRAGWVFVLILALLASTLPMSRGAFAQPYIWAGNRIKDHEVWDPDGAVLAWVNGNAAGYTEGETAAFRVEVEATEGEELKFQICLDLDAGTAFAFTDIEPWDTSYQQDGTHLTAPPDLADLTGELNGVNASSATIDTANFLGLEDGTLGTLCPVDYQGWEVEFTIADDGDATPDETVTAYVVYGGHIAAVGDPIASGEEVTEPPGGASQVNGGFQARIASEGTGAKSVNFQSGAIVTAVDLVSFTATPESGTVLIAWQTATEIDNLGFNLYRADWIDGPRIKLNAALIPGQVPGSPLGGSYQFVDRTVQPGARYYYWLEDVDLYGRATLQGPVTAKLGFRDIQLPVFGK